MLSRKKQNCLLRSHCARSGSQNHTSSTSRTSRAGRKTTPPTQSSPKTCVLLSCSLMHLCVRSHAFSFSVFSCVFFFWYMLCSLLSMRLHTVMSQASQSHVITQALISIPIQSHQLFLNLSMMYSKNIQAHFNFL